MNSLDLNDPGVVAALTESFAGNWDTAEAQLGSLAEKYPESHFLQLQLGETRYALGRLGEAVQAYERAIALKHDYGLAWYKRGVCHHRLGRLETALESFNRVIELNSQSHAMAAYFIGLINYFLGRDDEAVTGFMQFRAVSPGSYIANLYLAQLFVKRNEWEEAQPLLQDLAERNPRFAEVEYLLGITAQGMHQPTEAIRHFRRALEINPEDERARDRLALLTDSEWP